MTSIVLVILAIVTRVIPHPYNFTAVGALALFAGANLSPKQWWLPLAAMLISDYFLGFHATMLYVYGSFALAIGIGYLVRNKQKVLPLAGASLSGSVLFYLITNFGVWVQPHPIYAQTWQGLLDCYVAAIPFFRNTVSGDLVYTAALFGAYAYSQQTLLAKKQSVFAPSFARVKK